MGVDISAEPGPLDGPGLEHDLIGNTAKSEAIINTTMISNSLSVKAARNICST